ncbi:MAG: imidazolonepropionase, partial [Rhodanobacteraceae bacterium]
MSNRWDRLLIDCRLATLADNGIVYGAIEDAAIGWRDGVITYAGPISDLPDKPEATASKVESLHGAWITPGLIDCHTHLVFAGDRADEFERRLLGEGYEAIARASGGI